MVEFLQSSIGIIHKNHAESISLFIKQSVDKELRDADTFKLPKNRRRTFCVEGNISVGKTTFVQRIANETIELRDLVEIVPEPVAKWQDIGPEHFNILDAFYANPQRYAYTFQNYVFVTRVMQEKESVGGIKPLRLMERSVFSDWMVSIRVVHEANWVNEMKISIYDSWFDPVVSLIPRLIPDGFIYLRASPDTCHKRMMVRKIFEDGGVLLTIYEVCMRSTRAGYFLLKEQAPVYYLSFNFEFIWRASCLLGYGIGYSTGKETTCILASRRFLLWSCTANMTLILTRILKLNNRAWCNISDGHCPSCLSDCLGH